MNEGADLDSLSRQTNELITAGTPQLALDALKRSLPGHKNNPTFWGLAGMTHQRVGQLQQAVECYRRALSIDPKNLQALVSLGALLHLQGNPAEGRALFERALLVNPNSEESLILSTAGALLAADLRDRNVLVERVRRFIRLRPKLEYLIRAAYWAPFLDIDYDLERQIWATIEETLSKRVHAQSGNRPIRARERPKLRIGYVSPNFGDHPIGHVTKSLYRAHDRDRFQIHVYSQFSRPNDHSEYKRYIRESCDRYTDISGMDIATAQARIMDDEIDILVDLNGYMGTTGILEIFSGRPAPVQVYWLGHAGALGLSCYDYVIGDTTVTPAEEDRLYSEAIARLPHTFHPADRHAIADEYGSRGDYGLKENVVVFCAFCPSTKIDPEVFRAWMQILKAVPGSQLWLRKGRNPLVETNLSRAAEEHGSSKDRLVFDERIPDKRRHLGRHRLADLFLDTFTVNASTMAIDALWAGLPILTRPGRHFCSRNCSSFLKAVGLDDMICRTTQEYIERAVYFGTNPAALASVRNRLRENRDTHPLFDIEGFSRHLEDAYQTMWERWLSGKPPASFSS